MSQLLLAQNATPPVLSLVLPDSNEAAGSFTVNDPTESQNTILQETPDPDEERNIKQESELMEMLEKAPKVVKDVCLRFSTMEEQTMALYSLITLTGSLFPKVTITYHKKINYPALMLLIVFPPASGKGCLSLIRKLAEKINIDLIAQNKDLMRDYKLKSDQYKKALKADSVNLPPELPLRPMLLIPGNVTSAKLIEQLSNNGPDQMLMMFETEADAYGISASNNQHGSMISTILRQAYHHETVSQARKTDSELLIAETPKLVMVLSGTESQVSKIFHSNEDGLLSRFMILSGSSSAVWSDVSPDDSEESEESFFESLSVDYYEMWKFFKGRNIQVKFNKPQWAFINDFGENYLSLTYHFTGELASSIAKRHANMITRTAAIFTMIAYFEAKSDLPEAYCTDEHFEIASWMIKNSLKSSLALYKKLPDTNKNNEPGTKLAALTGMPDNFKLEDVKELFNRLKLKDRSRTRYIKEFLKSGYLAKIGHGRYQKTPMAYSALSQMKEAA